MTQLFFPAAIMLLSLIVGAAATFSRATEARKWSAVAVCGAFGFGAASFVSPFVSTASAFTVLHALVLFSLAVMGISYMFALAAATGSPFGKPVKILSGLAALIYAGFHITARFYGMGISGVTVTGTDSADIFITTFNTDVAYYIANGVMIGITAVLAVCALIGMSKKLIKPTSGERFIAVVSILLAGCTALGGVFTMCTVAAAQLLLLLIVKSIDRSDVIEFGASCALNSSNDGAIILDKKMNFLYANTTAKSVFFELSESDRSKMTKYVSTISDKETLTRGERIFSLKKGTYFDYTGSCDCNIIMMHDVTEHELRNTRLNEEAAVDSITGLNSRSSVIELLEKACAEMGGTLLNISFDGFKAINNLYGHEDANKLLSAFGTILRNNINNDDIRGRLGGEQFTVFLKNCTNVGVIANLTMRLEEQITDALHKQFGESVDVTVGVSVGAVFVPDYGKDYETLAGLAESARLKIKNSGGHGYDIYSAEIKAKDETIENINDFLTDTNGTADTEHENAEETDTDTEAAPEVTIDHLPIGDDDDDLSDLKL